MRREKIPNVYVNDSDRASRSISGEFLEYDAINSGNPLRTSGVFRRQGGEIGYIFLTMDNENRWFKSAALIEEDAWHYRNGESDHRLDMIRRHTPAAR